MGEQKSGAYTIVFYDALDKVAKQTGENGYEVANYTTQVPYAGTTSGSVNTYEISTPTITSLIVGMAVSLKFV